MMVEKIQDREETEVLKRNVQEMILVISQEKVEEMIEILVMMIRKMKRNPRVVLDMILMILQMTTNPNKENPELIVQENQPMIIQDAIDMIPLKKIKVLEGEDLQSLNKTPEVRDEIVMILKILEPSEMNLADKILDPERIKVLIKGEDVMIQQKEVKNAGHLQILPEDPMLKDVQDHPDMILKKEILKVDVKGVIHLIEIEDNLEEDRTVLKTEAILEGKVYQFELKSFSNLNNFFFYFLGIKIQKDHPLEGQSILHQLHMKRKEMNLPPEKSRKRNILPLRKKPQNWSKLKILRKNLMQVVPPVVHQNHHLLKILILTMRKPKELKRN